MTQWSNFPNGITSRGVPIPFGIVGDIYFVDSNNGNDGNPGSESEHPLATVDKAMTKATADNNDLIVLLPGHAETLSADTIFQIDKAGITIIGIGSGSRIPTFTSSVAAGCLNIDSDNAKVSNIRLTAGYTGGSTQAVNIADGLTGIVLDGIQCRDTTTAKEWLLHVSFAGTAVDCTIKNCQFIGLDGGSMTNSILFAGATSNTVIADNVILVDASDSPIDHDAAKATSILITRNQIVNQDTGNATGYCIEVEATSTGQASYNACFMNNVGAVVCLGEAMSFIENYGGNTAGSSGELDPAAVAIP